MNRERRRAFASLRVAWGAGVSVLVFWLILRFIVKNGAAPTALVPGWALAAILLTMLQIAIVAARWAFFTRQFGAPLDYRSALGAYYVSVFLNQVLPLGMIGDAARGFWHARKLSGNREQRPALDAATALILDRASGQLVLLAVVLLVLPAWWQPLHAALALNEPANGRRLALVFGLLLAALLGVLFYWGRSFWRRTARARRAFFQPRALAVHGAYSLASLVLLVAAFGCSSRALGFSFSFALALRVVPLVLAAASLPSFAFGTGSREASAAALYHLLGLRAADGAAIALGLGLSGFAASL
ncbi:MAG TPA: lysylphosphatidylglycerol synthase transmembrane domain-containing protein, partial [Polyangiaceae bacterium]